MLHQWFQGSFFSNASVDAQLHLAFRFCSPAFQKSLTPSSGFHYDSAVLLKSEKGHLGIITDSWRLYDLISNEVGYILMPAFFGAGGLREWRFTFWCHPVGWHFCLLWQFCLQNCVPNVFVVRILLRSCQKFVRQEEDAVALSALYLAVR